MKRSRVGLAEIADWDNLAQGFFRAAAGKRGRGDAEAFRRHLETELERLQSDLLGHSYRPGPLRTFSIRDPKPRIIHAPTFRDRVVHHALMAHVGPVLDRSLIGNSFACRNGKGTHAAVRRAAAFASRSRWFMHVDVAQYFARIDHQVLKARLRRKFSDLGLLDLFDRIIDAHGAGRGLPIGALTSQFFANHYLAGIDRHVAEHPLAKGYVRYMDDMVWWAARPEDCHAVLSDVTAALSDDLKLDLKAPVTGETRRGMVFCGYRILPGRVLLSRRRRRKFRQGWREVERDVQMGGQSVQLQRRMDALLGVLEHADCQTWRCKLFAGAGLHE